ncbi:MAG: PhzF family phenazine biosynthesis protein [Planctomycetota bacterium]
MQPPNLYHVDAFTLEPFSGNPAAVAILDAPADAGWMQRFADDMNLSETAYVVRPTGEGKDGDAWGLRWFTPAAEVELCGHATLSSAHILWDEGLVDGDEPIAFTTQRSGRLTCTRDPNGLISMDFPAQPPRPAEAPAVVLDATRVDPVASYRSQHDWILELASPQAVVDARPDFQALGEAPDTRGVAITAAGCLPDGPTDATGREADFVSRFFAPSLRVEEDPVTGSLHCELGPMWSARLDRPDLIGHQCSRRGGLVHVTHAAPDADRVTLAGHAITLVAGVVTQPVVPA